MERTKIIIILLLVFCLAGIGAVSAQEAEQQILDGSMLAAGQSFRFSVTADSDENLSFLGALPEVTAVLCPAGAAESACMTMIMEPERQDGTSVRFSFLVEELPSAGDYTLDILFSDETGTFEAQSASYRITGVRDAVNVVTQKVTVRPELLDGNGTPQIYGNTVYVNDWYTFRITADGSMNDSVVLTAALPASFSGLRADPASECMQYVNEDRTQLRIPGNAWNAGNGNQFSCRIRFTDAAWVAANPIVFSLEEADGGTYKSGIRFEMDRLSWNYYPVSVAKYPATHQFQIFDGTGTMVCSDMIPCGALRADEVYTATYKIPADWSTPMPAGRSLSARIQWPEDWALALQQPEDAALAAEYGTPCEVDQYGRTSLQLAETADGRYSASCTFVPGGITDPHQETMDVSLNGNSYQLSDLKVWLPASITKTQAVLTPSLTCRAAAGSEAAEQISGGTVPALYRTAGEFPNLYGSDDAPALYTLRAEVSGVPASRRPQSGDAVLVNWSVLDRLAETGDLPGCLVPSGTGYLLGTLEQTDDGTWAAECAFRFPETMSADTPAGTLDLQLLSGAYQTSARVQMSGSAFRRDTLFVDIDVPAHMLLMQPNEMRVSLKEENGGISDYLRAVLASADAALVSTWEHNFLTDCQGVYTLSENGEASCTADFVQSTDSPSAMHFELDSTVLNRLFNVQYRPAQDLTVPEVKRVQAVLTPSLTLRMTADAAETDAAAGGTIAPLYRTAGDSPNYYNDTSAPALYSLKASVSGVNTGSEPLPGDYVKVDWPVLDSLAASGDLPACLVPVEDGYMLGTLSASADGTWSAACDFRFPQTLDGNTAGAPMEMTLASAAYEAEARFEMSGNAFRTETLFVDVTVPASVPLMQQTEFRVKLTDSTGGLSDYTRAMLASGDISLTSDWIFNYATDCQGLYTFSETGEAVCGAYFDIPTGEDSVMHFDLNSPLIGSLFTAEFRPSADITVAGIAKTRVSLTPSLRLHMTEGSAETDAAAGGMIGRLYRSADPFPNASGVSSLPARYSLRAETGSIPSGYAPGAGDYIRVIWPLLDSLALTGDLPSCFVPDTEGYIMGDLFPGENGTWNASCDFRFPQTMGADTAGGTMRMELVSSSYEADASLEMSGQPFAKETLYVDLEIPSEILVKENTAFKARLTGENGELSEYMRAVLAYENISLFADWPYNYATSCQGFYEFDESGSAECSALFDFPVDSPSDMHFEAASAAAGELYDVVFRPSADIHVAEVSNVKATLTVQLLHAGEEIPLPASESDAFEVGEDYQLRFILKPEERFANVLNNVTVDHEGRVLDWAAPLMVRWAALPELQTSPDFYRDGDHFTARYDFNFMTGDIDLYGDFSILTAEVWIDGWDVTVLNGEGGLQLPSRINRKAVTLSFSDFTVDGSMEPVSDLFAGQTASFDVNIEGSMETMDLNLLLVGYEENGIQIPLSCVPQYESSSMRCSVQTVCSEGPVSENSAVCADDLTLFAVYSGDGFNNAAEAAPKTFDVKRNELFLEPVAEGSLSAGDLIRIQAASEDLQYMGYGSLNIGGRNVDSFLPRQTWTEQGDRFGTYPVIFRYQTAVPDALDTSLLRLEVSFESGSAAAPVQDMISLPAFMVSGDTVTFMLDFGSFDVLDDGRTPWEALDKAVTIKSLRARYPGSALVAPAARNFEADGLTFALKVATYYESETDMSLPNVLQFGGPFASEAPQQPYMVYCSQLMLPLECSAEMPVEAPVEEEPGETPGDGEEPAEPDPWIVSDPAGMNSRMAFEDQGCWGNLPVLWEGMPLIYINNAFNPQCYLAASGDSGRLLIASNIR